AGSSVRSFSRWSYSVGCIFNSSSMMVLYCMVVSFGLRGKIVIGRNRLVAVGMEQPALYQGWRLPCHGRGDEASDLRGGGGALPLGSKSRACRVASNALLYIRRLSAHRARRWVRPECERGWA